MKTLTYHLRSVLAGAACAAALAGCQTAPIGAPTVKTMDVNGARLSYAEQGRGEPVVFVHGAVSDYRAWDRQRAALAADGYRAISYTQRYFGTEPWGQNWPAFGVQTHSDDLAAFIRGLDTGPVHLVALSYGGDVVFGVALHHPELVRSAFLYEPSARTYVTDPVALKAIGDDAGAMAGPVVQALKDGNNAEAVRRLIDAVAGRPGYFAAQPATAQARQLDSARTMPLLFNPAKPPQISCAQLATIKPRVAIVRGSDARPFFRVIADEAARCMPSQPYIVVAKQQHLWPSEDVAGFNATLVGFLKGR